jgi:hypothetical protein
MQLADRDGQASSLDDECICMAGADAMAALRAHPNIHGFISNKSGAHGM